jgi:hypothetical protein
MVTRRDYTAEGVEAARSVLIELAHLLGEYKDDIVLIGGWIPELLLPHYIGHHIGSRDVDIALNHRKIREEGYKMIQDLLRSRGYQQGDQPFIFFINVNVGNQEIKSRSISWPVSMRGPQKVTAIRKCRAFMPAK